MLDRPPLDPPSAALLTTQYRDTDGRLWTLRWECRPSLPGQEGTEANVVYPDGRTVRYRGQMRITVEWSGGPWPLGEDHA